MRTVIVTGGCGYIGSHVARAFKQNGDKVFIIDRVSRRHTLKDIDGFFIDDFASDASLATIIDMDPDIIVHCAGTSLVGPSMTDPAEYYDNNISKTIKLLNVIKDFKNKPLIMFSSSASVYGEPNEVPIKETATIQPISPYGNTKAITETILKDYASAYGVDSVCFRYFNAAGAMPDTYDLGQEPGATHLVARVLEASLAGRAVTINGSFYDTPDGTCVRDYIHVWDIARAHVLAADKVLSESVDRTADCQVFNLGTNKGISNLEVVQEVNNKFGLPHVNMGEPRFGDPATLIADANKANTELNWRPEYSSLGSIVDTAYLWYCKHGIQQNT